MERKKKINKDTCMNKINSVFTKWKHLNNTNKCWSIVDDDGPIKFYEQQSKQIFKSESLLECCCERLFKIYSDPHSVTRKRWDRSSHFGIGEMIDLNIIEIIEEKCLYFIEFQIVPLLANYEYRYFQGIMYMKPSSMYIFTSFDLDITRKPSTSTFGKITFCSLFRNITEGKKCFLSTTVLNYNFGGLLQTQPINFKAIHEQIVFYQSFAADIKLYNAVYDIWKCHPCTKWQEPHLLKCSICDLSRYGTCDDITCMEPCIKQNQQTCLKCGSEILKK